MSILYKIKRSPDVFSKKVGDGWVILEKNKRYIRRLNGTASYIWLILEKPIIASEVVKRVAKKFKISEADIKKDVDDFLRQYIKFKLIVRDD